MLPYTVQVYLTYQRLVNVPETTATHLRRITVVIFARQFLSDYTPFPGQITSRFYYSFFEFLLSRKPSHEYYRKKLILTTRIQTSSVLCLLFEWNLISSCSDYHHHLPLWSRHT